jgi:hypothetical protein
MTVDRPYVTDVSAPRPRATSTPTQQKKKSRTKANIAEAAHDQPSVSDDDQATAFLAETVFRTAGRACSQVMDSRNRYGHLLLFEISMVVA